MSAWRTVAIGDVCELSTGGTPSRSNPEYFGGEIRWLVSGDIHRREIFECEGRITEDGVANSNARLLPINSVMIALNGQGKTRGTVAMLRVPATCNQSLVSISPRDGVELLPEFLYYNLHGRYAEIRKITGDDDNDRRGLNMPLIKAITLPLPPLPEQKRIVGILDEALEAIDKAKANTERNIENARALFESQLQSVFARRSKEWRPTRLKDVATYFGRGKSKHRPRNAPELYGGPYPFIQTGDIRNADHEIETYTQTYSECGLAQSKLWPAGTLCITIAANIAETAVLTFDACFPDSVIGLVPDGQKANSKFVEYLLHHFRGELKTAGKGSAQDNINLATFDALQFPFPSVDVQTQLADTLDEVRVSSREAVAVLRQKLAALEVLKQSTLQSAFAGEL